MIRHIIAFSILGACIALLGFMYMNPDDLAYQNSINLDYAEQFDDIPNNKYETGLAKKHPFIFWLVINQVWIFIICILVAIINVVVNYKKRGKFYQYMQKVYKEQDK